MIGVFVIIFSLGLFTVPSVRSWVVPHHSAGAQHIGTSFLLAILDTTVTLNNHYQISHKQWVLIVKDHFLMCEFVSNSTIPLAQTKALFREHMLLILIAIHEMGINWCQFPLESQNNVPNILSRGWPLELMIKLHVTRKQLPNRL